MTNVFTFVIGNADNFCFVSSLTCSEEQAIIYRDRLSDNYNEELISGCKASIRAAESQLDKIDILRKRFPNLSPISKAHIIEALL